MDLKSKASCNESFKPTKCWDALVHNLDVDKKIEPLPPQLLHPPELRLLGCSPPLQLPELVKVTVKRGTSSLVTNKRFR